MPYADLTKDGRRVARVTLVEGERVDVDVQADRAIEQERIEAIFASPKLTPPAAGHGDKLEEKQLEAFSRAWFQAVLFQRMPEHGYDWRLGELA